MLKNYLALRSFLEDFNIPYYTDYPFYKCSSFKVGGIVSLYIVVENEDKLFNLIKYLSENKMEYFVMRDGNNILVGDDGYEGIIISMEGDFDSFSFDGCYLNVSSAVKLERLSHEARIRNLAGIEFVALLNNTIGLAVHENLVAFGKSINDHIISVRVIELKDGIPVIVEYCKEEYALLNKNRMKSIRVLSVIMKLEEDSPDSIDNRIDWYRYIRGSVVPLEANIGPVFEDTNIFKAHEMVERVGGLDMKFGCIQWHRRFPNYIINMCADNDEINHSKAKVNDVMLLIDDTKKKIEQHYAISPNVNVTIL